MEESTLIEGFTRENKFDLTLKRGILINEKSKEELSIITMAFEGRTIG